MKANELRIGNCLMSDGIPVQIDGRTIFDFWHYGDNGVIPLRYKPIPLTEEWLLRFGFEKSYNWVDKSATIELAEKDNGYVMLEDSCYYCSQTLLYVHQLQNLFFALKGEELELK